MDLLITVSGGEGFAKILLLKEKNYLLKHRFLLLFLTYICVYACLHVFVHVCACMIMYVCARTCMLV